VWVTGATGFLGGHVANTLESRGYDVVGFARRTIDSTIAKVGGFKFIESGPFAAPLLQRVYERAGPPVAVFHGIGASSVAQANADPAADIERTLRTTECLLEMLGQTAPSARLIYPSSAAVYGATASGPIPENAPTQPVSVYGANKLRAEEICRDFARRSGLQTVIVRFFSVYGPPQRKLLLWDLGLRLRAGERRITLGGTGEETRDFIHVRDAAAIVGALIVATQPPQFLNAGTGRATSIHALAKAFVAACGVPADIQFDGRTRPGDPAHQQANISKLSTIGFTSSMTLEQGLTEYADWLHTAFRDPG
jgi:UDP-glucose 4-epimerase